MQWHWFPLWIELSFPWFIRWIVLSNVFNNIKVWVDWGTVTVKCLAQAEIDPTLLIWSPAHYLLGPHAFHFKDYCKWYRHSNHHSPAAATEKEACFLSALVLFPRLVPLTVLSPLTLSASSPSSSFSSSSSSSSCNYKFLTLFRVYSGWQWHQRCHAFSSKGLKKWITRCNI